MGDNQAHRNQPGGRCGIQGYTGVAVVDEAAQIVVEAQAHGTGSEQELLVPLVEASAPVRADTTALTADAGYHSEANLAHLAQANIDAWLPDNGYRKRDARYAGQAAHQAKPDPLWNKTVTPKKSPCFTPADFITVNGYAALKFRSPSGGRPGPLPVG